MSRILCLETSATNCSVAIATEDGGHKNHLGIKHCLDLVEMDSGQFSHGEKLHVFIDTILHRNGLHPRDLNAIAVSRGPGSYTGLRIGVSSAKGLCYALDIPLLSVDTLQALSYQDVLNKEYTIAFLDARRMEVYSAVYSNGILIQPVAATVLDEESFLRFRESGATIIGTGTQKFRRHLEDAGASQERTTFVEVQPTALTMCDLAIEALKKGNTEDVAYFEPYYLKELKTG